MTTQFKIRSHFKETDILSIPTAELPPVKPVIKAGNRFKVLLIQEGLGNLRDCFYYTKSALQSASPLFEGKKCFADHPSSIEEQTRPERSTRDILGHFENVQYEESADGRGAVVADLVVLTNPTYAWAQTLLSTAVGYAQKFQESEFVGLSINASGEATEVPLDEFMKETEFPPSILSKLQTAQSEGIPLIRVVNRLKDAVSCDLVTEAGAGGKILQMIESSKKLKEPTMKKVKEAFPPSPGKAKLPHEGDAPMEGDMPPSTEAKAPEAEKSPEGDAPAKDMPSSDNPAGGADDVDQDKELFAKMIQQYLGDEVDSNDPEMQDMAKTTHDAHKDAGMKDQEAYEAAGNHLKMAMAIGKKMHEKQMASPQEAAPPAHEQAPASSATTVTVAHPAAPAAAAPAKESAKYIQAMGEIARLKEALKKYELDAYLDKKLSESKKAVSVTKTFREALGTPKSKEQIDHAYKLFMSGADCGSEDDAFMGFLSTEKTNFKESDASAAGSFSDCAETN